MKLKAIARRASGIIDNEGLLYLFRRGFVFTAHYLFTLNEHYLFEYNIPKIAASGFLRKDDFTYRIVSTNQQVDELISEGFKVLDHITYFDDMRQRVCQGTFAVCIVVDHELAHITWIAMNQKAKDIIDNLPYRVDFSTNEVCSGDIITSLKYRRKGLAAFAKYIAIQYLNQRGKIILRSSVNSDNIASLKLHAKLGAIKYAKARYLRILGFRFWMEKPLA